MFFKNKLKYCIGMLGYKIYNYKLYSIYIIIGQQKVKSTVTK